MIYYSQLVREDRSLQAVFCCFIANFEWLSEINANEITAVNHSKSKQRNELIRTPSNFL